MPSSPAIPRQFCMKPCILLIPIFIYSFNQSIIHSLNNWVNCKVFENYGQPNYIYFMYHGFILSEEAGGNSHDCVNFELALTEGEKALLDVQKAAELAQVSV